MYNLVLYDTSNFVDFPIGGQLTSIRNFLLYLTEECSDECDKILLIGVTTDRSKVGKIQKVNVGKKHFDFLPILYRSLELNNIQSSMRVEYLKALFKFRKNIPYGKKVLHYLHTPEAFIQIKLCHPFAKTVIFSHGSFFNMTKGFRFYKNNKLIEVGFKIFIYWILKKANLIFTLDKISKDQYLKYNKSVISVNNSIILPYKVEIREECHNPIKLLFVGRLSKVKRVDGIIKAVSLMNEKIELTILGDGEEREYLQKIIKNKKLENCVHLIGAVSPSEVKKYMIENDILIMNSILEGKPMTILEAMSYGMPIITTDVGGISEIVKFNINSIKIDEKIESIISAILDIENNYKKFSNNALVEAKKFDYKLVNKEIFNKLMEVLE